MKINIKPLCHFASGFWLTLCRHLYGWTAQFHVRREKWQEIYFVSELFAFASSFDPPVWRQLWLEKASSCFSDVFK